MIRIEGSGKILADVDIEDLEKTLQVNLPAQYRRFLIAYNGGVPVPDVVDVEGVPGSPTDIQVFFGIDQAIESSDLIWNWQTFSGRIPETLLPIACDSGGNLFCLSLSAGALGHVFFVDLEQESLNTYLVAEEFDTFLQKIRSLE